MMSVAEILERIRDRNLAVGILGMDQDGVSMAAALASKGLSVVGFDPDPRVVETLGLAGTAHGLDNQEAGPSRFSTDPSALASCDALVILAHPASEDSRTLDESASRCSAVAGGILRSGMPVLVVASGYPAALGEQVQRILERESGLKSGVDFPLGFSVGTRASGTDGRNQPKVIGGADAASLEVGKALASLCIDSRPDDEDPATKDSNGAGCDRKILFLDTMYPAFLDGFRRSRQDLGGLGYLEFQRELMATRFGDSDSYAIGMKRSGWRAEQIVANCQDLQARWARENDASMSGEDLLVEQVRRSRPDVLYFQNLSYATSGFLERVRPFVGMCAGQIASPLPAITHLAGLDAMFTSFPHWVDRFRQSGLASWYMPLAFDPRNNLGLPAARDIGASFVGGLSPDHLERARALEEISSLVPMEFWGYGANLLPAGSSVRATWRGEAWGKDMFHVLGRSRITLNHHIDCAERWANNMRLFEATGCGTLLLTDAKENLGELFVPDQEVVTWRTPREAADKIRYFLSHPDEAAGIARAGQARTLREHTYDRRMAALAEILERQLQRKAERSSRRAPDLAGISKGHARISPDQIEAHMLDGWRDPSIPASQRDLVEMQLDEMYAGHPADPFRTLAEALKDATTRDSSLIEIGCASGYYCETLEYLLGKPLRYTGVDYSAPMIDLARHHYPKRTFVVADGADLPFPDASFDIAVSSCVLLHVPNWREHLRETVRVAGTWVVAARTPISRSMPTSHLRKLAYGVETVELLFNEGEFLEACRMEGLERVRSVVVSEEPGSDLANMTYVFRKTRIAVAAGQKMTEGSRVEAGSWPSEGATRHFCTSFDKNYLARALALFESLERHCPGPYTVFAVCLDKETRSALERISPRNVVPVDVSEIERGDEELARARIGRTVVEYYWTLTPTVMLRLLDRVPAGRELVYLDADLYFFHSAEPIFEEFSRGDALIHEHRFTPALKHLEPENGRFNVGLVGIRNSVAGREVVQWWRERCNEWCFHRYEDGKMGDQLYLDHWPRLFPTVRILQHKGAGVAPWNFDTVRISRNASGQVLVDSDPLIFVHFQSFQPIQEGTYLAAKHATYPLSQPVLDLCYREYAQAIERGLASTRKVFGSPVPGCDPATFVTASHVLLSRNAEGTWVHHKAGEPVPSVVASVAGATPRLLWEPGRRVTGEEDLLHELQGRRICRRVRRIAVVGAHEYQESALLDSMFPDLSDIVLFEPIPPLYNALVERFSPDRRIRVSDFALSDTDGTAEFHITNNFASSSLLSLGKHKEIFPHVVETTRIPVRTRRMGTALRELGVPSPDMLFVDVQGAEYQVLSGIDQAILEGVSVIYTEASTEPLYEGSRVLEEVKRLLGDRFAYLGFSPLTNETPTHGNALFVRKDLLDEVFDPATSSDSLAVPTSVQGAPLVTAIVSTYKSEKFLRGCLEGLVAQTLFQQGLLEILVIDAGSPEAEADIALEFATAHPDLVRYIRTSRREPLYTSWNRGVRAARGQFLTNANTDDRHREDALERLALELSRHPETDLVYADCYLTYQENATMRRHVRAGFLRRPDWSIESMMQGCHMGPQPMWRRTVHERLGGFDEGLKAAGDYEFWCRMAAAGMRMRHVPEFLGLYLENPQGISNADPRSSMDESLQVKRKYMGSLPAPHRDYTDNYFATVRDPSIHVQVVVFASRFGRDLERLLVTLEATTSFPHVVCVVDDSESRAVAEMLRLQHGMGRIHAVAMVASNTQEDLCMEAARRLAPDAIEQVVPDAIDEVSVRGWLDRVLSRDPAQVPAAATSARPQSGTRPVDVLVEVKRLLGQNREIEAENLLRKMHRDAGVVEVSRILSQMLFEQKRYSEGCAVVEEALRRNPDRPELLSDHAALLIAAGRGGEAVAPLRRLREMMPEDAEIRNALRRLGQSETTTSVATSVATTAPTTAREWEAVVFQSAERKDLAGIANACGELVVLADGDPEALRGVEPVLATFRRNMAGRESALAHRMLDGSKGLEIGGAAHNPFGLDTRNVGMLSKEYVADQIKECGSWMPVDIHTDAAEIPVPDESEDFIVSSHVLEHPADVAATLLEWFRIVRNGGYLYIVTPLPDASPADRDKVPATWAHVFDDLVHQAKPEEEPEQGLPGHGHYHLLALDSLKEISQGLFGERCQIVAEQERDDKVGNGCTIVLQKIRSLEESFPWEVRSDEDSVALLRQSREPGISRLSLEPAALARHPVADPMPAHGDFPERFGRWNAGYPEFSARGTSIPVALAVDPRTESTHPEWFRRASTVSMERLEDLGLKWMPGPPDSSSFFEHAKSAAREAERTERRWFGVLRGSALVTPRLLELVRRKMSNRLDVVLACTDEVRELDFRGSPIPGNLEIGRFDLVFCRTEWWKSNSAVFEGVVGTGDLFCALARNGRAFPVLRAGHLVGLAGGEPPDGSDDPLWDSWISKPWASGVPCKDDSDAALRSLIERNPLVASRRSAVPRKTPKPPLAAASPRTAPVPDGPSFVNVGMVTWNRLEFTKQAIEAFRRHTTHPHKLTVVDNGSTDGTGEWLQELHRQGVVSNLVLLPENVGIAKASNIAWAAEPGASHYLKLDSDMVVQKDGWLEAMVEAAKSIPDLGALGYSVEPVQYPVETIGGVKVRPKRDANIGGACFLVPKSVHERLGWWCEDYGLYGEEDGDYALRLRLAGLFNAYMEDDDMFLHLPGGKAGAIDPRDLSAIDPDELRIHEDYRLWKDEQRRRLQAPGGILPRNAVAYQTGTRGIHVPRGTFLGVLGEDLQAFQDGDDFVFLPLAGAPTPSHRERVRQFLSDEGRQSLATLLARDGKAELLRCTDAEGADRDGAGRGSVEVSIVIPVHGHLDLTKACIESVRATTDSATTEIVVVDDASPDGTAQWLRSEEGAGRLRAVALPSNKGFAGACNAGAAASTGRVVVFLNNDTICRKGWLEALLAALEDPTVGIAGSRLLYPEGDIQHAGMVMLPDGMPDHVFRHVPGNDPRVLVSRDRAFVTGACIALSRDLHAKVGGFDEGYRMYVEDVDLCIKVWNEGLRVRYVADSVLVHLESRTVPDQNRRAKFVQDGVERLMSRWMGRWPETLAALPEWPRHFRAGLSLRWCAGMLVEGSEASLHRSIVALLDPLLPSLQVDPGRPDPKFVATLRTNPAASALWTRILSRPMTDAVTVFAASGAASWRESGSPTGHVALVRAVREFDDADFRACVLAAGSVWACGAQASSLVRSCGTKASVVALPELDDPGFVEALLAACGTAMAGAPRTRGETVVESEASARTVPVRWCGPLFNYSGYARLAREAVAGLMDNGVPVTVDPLLNDPEWFAGLRDDSASLGRWKELLQRSPQEGVLVACDLPRSADGRHDLLSQISEANPGCSAKVAWTMFETDRLPTGWAESLNRMDQVWVPSRSGLEAFRRSGVEASKLHVVPGGVDPAAYDPTTIRPMVLPGPARATTFLSVFQWGRRKGWDTLLAAWSKAFAPGDDVRLVLRCHGAGTGPSIRERMETWLREQGLSLATMAPVVLLEDFIPEPRMASLYAACDVFVLPTRGEGWGLPFLEAMASGKPCIATSWGGHTDFLHDGVAWMLPVADLVAPDESALRENPFLTGEHRWAEVSVESVVDALRSAQSDPASRLRKGRQARVEVLDKWTRAHVAEAVTRALAELPSEGRSSGSSPRAARTTSPAREPAHGRNVVTNSTGTLVNIGMITYNRLEFTRQVMDNLRRDTLCPHVLTVVDNASTDGTREYLMDLESRGLIDNLVLLEENVGVAKASNLAWSQVPEATHYMKLDNDIVFLKDAWLDELVRVVDAIPELGAVSYNFEPQSYPVQEVRGIRIRPKRSNLGGACLLIPKRTQDRLGVWSEDYGIYGEEDWDYGVRVVLSGMVNAYLDDEDIGFHLPAGKAAIIDDVSFVAKDGEEEVIHAEYRRMKDACRAKNHNSGIVERNLQGYRDGSKPLKVVSRFVDEYRAKAASRAPRSSLTVLVCSHDHPSTGSAFVRVLQHLQREPGIRLLWSSETSPGVQKIPELARIFATSERECQVSETLPQADIVLVQRTFVTNRAAMDLIRASGKPWVLEVDDLLWELPPWHPEVEAYARVAPLFSEAIRQADAVFASTIELGEVVEAIGGDVHVVPNLVDEGIWPPDRKPADSRKVIIGYAGGHTHSPDLALVEGVLERIAKTHGDKVGFRFLGCWTPRLAALPNATCTRFVSNYTSYSGLLSSSGMHIALAPLDDHAFNQCKSSIKFLEYSSCGIAGVYADLAPYRRVVRDGENGFLAGRDPERWFQCIDQLVRDRSLRERMAERARGEVVDRHRLRIGGSPLVEALKIVHQEWEAKNPDRVAKIAGDRRLDVASRGISIEQWGTVSLKVSSAVAGLVASISSRPAVSGQSSAFVKEGQAGILEREGVSMVVLVRDCLDVTKECLASLELHTPEAHEILLVDNGSNAETTAWLRDWVATRPNSVLVRNDDNRGFAGGNNQGLALAKGRFLLLLNNDTVLTPGWLGRMLEVFERHPECGAVGPVSNRVSGPQLDATATYKDAAGLVLHAKDRAQRFQGRSDEILRAVGFCLLFRREVFEAVGGLDERFGKGNFEDDDFSLRVRHAGWSSRMALDSFVHHVGGATFRGENIDYTKSLLTNWAIFLRKWGLPEDLPYEKGYPLQKSPPKSALSRIETPSPLGDHELVHPRVYLPAKKADATGAKSKPKKAESPEAATAKPSVAAEYDLESLSAILFQVESAVAMQDSHQADTLSREAVELHPDQPLAWLSRAMVLRGAGKSGKALEALTRSAAVGGGAEVVYETMALHLQEGRDGPALVQWNLLRTKHPQWVDERKAMHHAQGLPWLPDRFAKPGKAPKKPAGKKR